MPDELVDIIILLGFHADSSNSGDNLNNTFCEMILHMGHIDLHVRTY